MFAERVVYLGNKIDKGGIRADMSRVPKLIEFEPLKLKKST